MLRKLALAIIIMPLVLMPLLSGIIVQAMSPFIGPYIIIQSPDSARTYTNTTIPLELLASVRYDQPETIQFIYSLDDTANATLTNVTKTGTVGGYDFHASTVLSNVSPGNHTLDATSIDASGGTMSTSVEFKVDLSYKSPFLLLSPKNTTYPVTNINFTDVSLTYTVNEKILWSTYILWEVETEPQIREGPVSGNLTLSELPIGNYMLAVNGWSNSGPINQTIYFTVIQPAPFPTVMITIVTIIAILIGVGLLFYHRMHKKSTSDVKNGLNQMPTKL